MLAQHSIQQQGETVSQFLIHWRNKSVEEVTWEEELKLKSKFLTFSLEDKTLLDVGGQMIERESQRRKQGEETALDFRHGQPIWHVYSRRKKEGHVEERKRIQLEDGIHLPSFFLSFPSSSSLFLCWSVVGLQIISKSLKSRFSFLISKDGGSTGRICRCLQEQRRENSLLRVGGKKTSGFSNKCY